MQLSCINCKYIKPDGRNHTCSIVEMEAGLPLSKQTFAVAGSSEGYANLYILSPDDFYCAQFKLEREIEIDMINIDNTGAII